MATTTPRAPRERMRPASPTTLVGPSTSDAAAAGAPSEATATLRQLAHNATLRIPPELLAEHVLAITAGADWPVVRGAMEAVLRRCAFAQRDRLRVATRPGGASPFGAYTTRRARAPHRPYTTWLTSLRPLRASCDCPDYLRSSLGLCKHLLVVVDDLAAGPRQLQRALHGRSVAEHAALAWDPVRPLTGRGDWLARVKWHDGGGTPAATRAELAQVKRWFKPGEDGELRAQPPGEDRPLDRAVMVDDLLHVVRQRRHGAEPALRALLLEERKLLERLTVDRVERPQLEQGLRSLKRPLYPYQREGVLRFLDTGRLLLADDMGLGKTVQATAACHALWRAGRVRRGLLIVPASLKSQWQREWQLFTDAPIVVVEGAPQQRQALFRRRSPAFLLVNYEQVLRDLPVIQGWNPDLIVLDEAQRIKNWATRTAACVKQLKPAYRLVLTGTPMENRLEELASIVEWVDDHALEPKWRLVPWHTAAPDADHEAGGARNLDTLRARLAPCMLRRVRSEILRQLPPRTDTVLPVDLTDEQRDEHDALNQSIARLVWILRKRPLTQAEFLRLMTLLTTQRMIANGLGQIRFEQVWPQLASERRPTPQVLAGLHSPKLAELREIVAQVGLQQQRKIVVFSQWRRMLLLAQWAVADLLQAAGLRATFFTGRETQRQRTKNIVEFHDDPRVRVLFATDAGGVGLNLQRAASCCVNLELPWNPAVLEQRIGRIFRMGQKRPIDVYNLVAQDCIESRIAALVSEKRALFVGLFDGKSDEIRFDRSASFLANVERLIDGVSSTAAATGTRNAPADGAESNEEASVEAESLVDAAVEREVDALVAAASGTTAAQAPIEQAVAPALTSVSAAAVQRLFTQIEIQPTAQGGMRIEANAEAAATLGALFEGLAKLLRTAEGGR